MKRDDVDLLAIGLAGARLQPEKSNALPAKQYGDPAKFVKLRSEENCSPCIYSRPGKMGEFCGKGKEYGKRCLMFKERGKK